jgi:hypothetical protein
MRISSLAFILVATAAAAGCGGMMGPGAGNVAPTAASYQVPKESQDALRQQEKTAYEAAERAEDEQLDKLEKDALKALRGALGKEPAFPGGPQPYASSVSLKELKAAGFKMRIEPVIDGDGKAVAGGDFLQLKDSFTDRMQVLSRKIAEQKASPAEMKEVQAGAKHVVKLNDVRSQFMNVSMATMQSNSHVQTQGLSTMLKVSGMIRSRKMMSMELDAQDYERIRKSLERAQRAQAIAAATMGMVAAYQAVVNGKGDPKALDVIAEATIKSFPIKTQVTDEDAKSYVKNLGENVAKEKARYEGWMRAAYGDAKYERDFKANIDAMFRQAETAQSQKSVTEMAQDNMKKFREDREKCARGEPIDPGSPAAGPGCDAARKAALANGGGGNAQVNDALKGAAAAQRGDLGGTLDAAASLAPGDGPIKGSLQGIAALSKGDSKGALNAALGMASLVPGGSAIKEGLGLAGKLLGLFG